MAQKITLSAEELAAFAAQLSLTVKTGIPLSEAVMILMEDAETDAAKKLLGTILDKLEIGASLADALKATEVFPVYMTQMIEIGETSGRLDHVLDSLHRYYDREDNIAKSAKSAITYPAIMLVILIVIIIILVTKVLPIFQQVFNTLGGEMTPLAQGAMRVGEIISNGSVVLVCIVVAIAVILIVMRLTPGGRKAMGGLGQRLFRQLTDRMAAAKFASGMSLMLASGLDVDRSVELTLPLMSNPKMYDKVDKLKGLIGDGASFTDSVVATKIFSGMQSRMLALGFKSGNLDNVMDGIADNYEKEVDERLDSLISIIEPTMVAILCVIVGLILLSAMLPLLGVMSSIM
ncbi:MAG: type II secretion system F family protein [Clostridiales Family XIII bacterium]|jgi:type IV pilus assembly protein PilC|nr:type II secretion system F family protein [Clostridiales Family XIII bacterium]